MKPTKDVALVTIQAILLAIFLFRIPGTDTEFGLAIRYTGLAIAIVGILVIISAMITLNTNLTPFPSPKSNSQLVTAGLYKYIRHPIYTGIILLTGGYGTYSENTLRLLVTAALLILFRYKAKYEEGLLKKKFPEYGQYSSSTKMFFPGIY